MTSSGPVSVLLYALLGLAGLAVLGLRRERLRKWHLLTLAGLHLGRHPGAAVVQRKQPCRAPAPPSPRSAIRPMRVLLLPSSYLPLGGGLQTATHALARQLRARGHDVRVVTCRFPRHLPAREVIDGVPVERWQFLTPDWRQLAGGRPDLFAASLYYYPSLCRRLDGLLRDFQPDVVNLHFPDRIVPFLLRLRRAHHFRLVVSLHGNDVRRFDEARPRPSQLRAFRAVLREADAITACSRQLLDRALSLQVLWGRRQSVIYNGVDPSAFADQAVHAHPRPYLLAVGRLTWAKGFDMLLEAFARLGPSSAGVDLLVAGDGEERAALEALASRLGLTGRVHFLGWTRPADVVRLLNGCRFLVVPSRREAFGLAAVEALAAGKPVLATRIGGMACVLSEIQARLSGPEAAGASPGRTVRMVRPEVAELADGLRQLLDSAAVDGEGVRDLVLRNYSWDETVRGYERVFAGAPSREAGSGGWVSFQVGHDRPN